MQKHHTSEETLTQAQLQAVINQLQPTAPITAYRVVGGRIELMLLGGVTLQQPAAKPSTAAEPVEEVEALTDLTVKQLRIRARELALSGYSKMNKEELITAIEEA